MGFRLALSDWLLVCGVMTFDSLTQVVPQPNKGQNHCQNTNQSINHIIIAFNHINISDQYKHLNQSYQFTISINHKAILTKDSYLKWSRSSLVQNSSREMLKKIPEILVLWPWPSIKQKFYRHVYVAAQCSYIVTILVSITSRNIVHTEHILNENLSQIQKPKLPSSWPW